MRVKVFLQYRILTKEEMKHNTKILDQSYNFKTQFNQFVQKYDKEFKSNNLLYRNKYFDLLHHLQSMYHQATICYRKVLHYPYKQQSQPKYLTIYSEDSEKTQSPHQMFQLLDPLKTIEYSITLFQFVSNLFQEIDKKMENQKRQILQLFHQNQQFKHLETLASMNLQKFQLKLQVKQLQDRLRLVEKELEIERNNNSLLNIKVNQLTNDFDQTIFKIADILQKSQNDGISLKQQNRLQKQLLQSQKIEFERYKTDFKRKPTAEQKQQKIRHILDKKYQSRQKLLLKQMQKIMSNKFAKQNR